jgi:hypothetical protein
MFINNTDTYVGRFLHILCNWTVGLILLNGVLTFDWRYLRLAATDKIIAGAAPFNRSLLYHSPERLVYSFLSFAPYLLRDRTWATLATPISTSCSTLGATCFSFILPGGAPDILIDSPETRTTPYDVHREAITAETSYIVQNATGYHLDYLYNSSYSFSGTECKIFGNPKYAITLCLSNADSILSAGINASVCAKVRLGCVPGRIE